MWGSPQRADTAPSPHRVPVGAGQSRAGGAGGAQAAKGAPGAIHPAGAAHTAATAVRPVVPITAPQTHPQLQAASPQLNNCLRYSAQQPAGQARNAMQMGTYGSLPGQHGPVARLGRALGSATARSVWDREGFICS